MLNGAPACRTGNDLFDIMTELVAHASICSKFALKTMLASLACFQRCGGLLDCSGTCSTPLQQS
jgi:hypothetical protein